VDDLEDANNPCCPPATQPVEPTTRELLGQVTMQVTYNGVNISNSSNNYHFVVPEGVPTTVYAELRVPSLLERRLNNAGVQFSPATVRDVGYSPDSPNYDPSNPDCFTATSANTYSRTCEDEFVTLKTPVTLSRETCCPQAFDQFEITYSLDSGTFWKAGVGKRQN
jgi:hypothetical protein